GVLAHAGTPPLGLYRPVRARRFKYTSPDRCLRLQVSAAFVVQSDWQDPMGLPDTPRKLTLAQSGKETRWIRWRRSARPSNALAASRCMRDRSHRPRLAARSELTSMHGTSPSTLLSRYCSPANW